MQDEEKANIEQVIKENVTLGKKEDLDIKITKKSKEKYPPYSIIGNGITTKDFKEDVVIDAFAVIGSLSSQQLLIFLYFKEDIVRSQTSHHFAKTIDSNPNVVEISISTNDIESMKIRSLIRRNSNGKTLIEKKIVKRIKNRVYMVNPYLLIPSNNFKDAVANWDRLD